MSDEQERSSQVAANAVAAAMRVSHAEMPEASEILQMIVDKVRILSMNCERVSRRLARSEIQRPLASREGGLTTSRHFCDRGF